MERQARSNLIKLLFAEDESDVSSTICEDPAEQNQSRSQDELTNPNHSNAMDTIENDFVSILCSESVDKKCSKRRKREIKYGYTQLLLYNISVVICCRSLGILFVDG